MKQLQRSLVKLKHSYLFSHLGRKHQQKIIYSQQACRQFNLLAANNTNQVETKMNAKSVNRLFVCCLFSRIIGNNFPLSIYLSQSINYKKDVPINSPVVGQVQVVKDLDKNSLQKLRRRYFSIRDSSYFTRMIYIVLSLYQLKINEIQDLVKKLRIKL